MASKYDDAVVTERARKAMMDGFKALEALANCKCERCAPMTYSMLTQKEKEAVKCLQS